MNLRFSHAELYKIIAKDNFERAFPNLGIVFCMFFALWSQNAQLSNFIISRMKYLINRFRRTKQQDKLDFLSSLMVGANDK